MLLQEAIKLRILELADERGYSVNKLAERSGITPSFITTIRVPNERASVWSCVT